MATRKSTTRGKTKTANAKTTKSAKTTKPSRVQSAASGRSSARAETARPTGSARTRVTLLTLRRILMMAAGLYVILAVAAGVLMSRATQELTVGYLTRDELVSRASTVFAPAMHVLYDLEIRWALVALLVISLVLPLLYLTKMERPYAARLRGRVIPWRWIDIAITSAVMLEIVALLAGVQDIVALKAIGGLAALAAVFGWLSERENENAPAPLWGAYLGGVVSGLLAWILVGIALMAASFYGIVRLPWYVYALYGTLAVGFLLMHFNQSNQHKRIRNWKDYMAVERNYLLITTLTKAAFAVILIVGLRTR
jgi:hypothetical protein